MLVSYHNHSTWSDGRTGITELAAGARHFGVKELGISDHYTLHPSGDPISWSMPVKQLDEYIEKVHAAAHLEAGNPKIRLGLEVDWFPSMQDEIQLRLHGRPFDFLIGSVHFIDKFPVDSHAEDWVQLSHVDRRMLCIQYWHLIQSMAQSRLFDIVAHLDLYKKFGLCPDTSDTPEAHAALDAIAEAGMVVELNTAGWHKPCEDAYPSVELLAACKKRDISVMISADAHRPEHLVRDFKSAVKRLKQVGYDRVVRFDQRHQHEMMLAESHKEAAQNPA